MILVENLRKGKRTVDLGEDWVVERGSRLAFHAALSPTNAALQCTASANGDKIITSAPGSLGVGDIVDVAAATSSTGTKLQVSPLMIVWSTTNI